jgi:hypothetical protein
METTTTPTRVDQFKTDISDMKLKTGTANKEGSLQALGVILMIVGIAIAIGSYISSTGQDIALDQNELIIFAIAGLCITVMGAALFLRYSLAKFFRFWLLRQMYEGQSHIDQVVDAIRER